MKISWTIPDWKIAIAVCFMVTSIGGIGWAIWERDQRQQAVQQQIEAENEVIAAEAAAEGWKKAAQDSVALSAELQRLREEGNERNQELLAFLERLEAENQELKDNIAHITQITTNLSGTGVVQPPTPSEDGEPNVRADADVNTDIVTTNTGEAYAKTTGVVKLFDLKTGNELGIIPVNPKTQKIDITANIEVKKVPEMYRWGLYSGVGVNQMGGFSILGGERNFYSKKIFNNKFKIRIPVQAEWKHYFAQFHDWSPENDIEFRAIIKLQF